MSTKTNSSGCSACKLSSVCSLEGKDQECVPTAIAFKAIMWAFGLPLLLMFAMLLVGSLLHWSDGVKALSMLGSLIPYYILLRIYRNKLL